MSIRDFQRALSEMTLDARLAAAVRREGNSALSGYELTLKEQRRLVDAARQPGMDLNCTLARGNRFMPIVDVFPLTCELLKPSLRELLEELWNCRRPTNYQLVGEEEAFTAFMEGKFERREIADPYAEEVFRYECACLELAKSLRYVRADEIAQRGARNIRLAQFHHDPRILVRALESHRVPPPDLPVGNYPVRIALRGDVLEVDLE